MIILSSDVKTFAFSKKTKFEKVALFQVMRNPFIVLSCKQRQFIGLPKGFFSEAGQQKCYFSVVVGDL